jgi:hypothetical protein
MKNLKSTFYPIYATRIGHITFAVLAVLAFVFFKERTLLLDPSFQSFMVLKGDYYIMSNRFGATMTLMFPIIAAKLGGSLRTVLTAYSLSFVIVHWVMFWICSRVLKQPQIALVIVFFNVFLVNNTFYWAQNECIQAISLCLVFWSLLLRRGSLKAFMWYDYPIMSVILVTVVYFHPLIMFPYFFMVAYFLLETRRKESIAGPLSIALILTAMSAFIAVFMFKLFITPSGYDSGAMGRLGINDFMNFVLQIKNVPSYKDFQTHLWSDFALIPISLSVITLFYLIKKRILKLLLVWISVVGYIIIVMVSYREGGHWFHVESQYLPLSIFLIMPLVWEVIPEIANMEFSFFNSKSISETTPFPLVSGFPSSMMPLASSRRGVTVFLFNRGLIFMLMAVCITLLYRIGDMYQTHDFYTKRVEYIGELLEKTKKLEGTKFVVEEKLIDKSRLMQTWGFGYESLYYSALQSPDSVRNIAIYADRKDISWQLFQTTTFQAVFNSIPYNQLNQRLFHQTDTIRPYRLLEEKDLR